MEVEFEGTITVNGAEIADARVKLDLADIDDAILTEYATEHLGLVEDEVDDLDTDFITEANALVDGLKMGQPRLGPRMRRFLEDMTGRTI